MSDDARLASKILIVDDEPINVRVLERLLASEGYRNVRGTTDPQAVLGLYRGWRPDLVLLDLRMPRLDGFAVLELLRSEIPGDEFVPILVLTADDSRDVRHRALAAGAKDFVSKPFEHVEVLLRIANLLETRRLHRDARRLNAELETQNRSLEETIRERTERVLQSEKVATMGSLLAGVAHELNNPLTILTGQAQLLRLGVEDEAIKRRADKICEAADRCVRIVRNFLSLARQRAPERTEVFIAPIVQGAVELLAYQFRTDGVAVTVDVAPGLPRLAGDPHQLHQVLVNLLANAHHALRTSPGPRQIVVTARHEAEGNRVLMEVADTGPGIPLEVQQRIFEPFFTTKQAGEGTGLGLSLCRGIVEEHGGTIEVESDPGQGARFAIRLPIVPLAPARDVAATTSEPPPVSPKTVLVVDDEVEIAAILAEVLTEDGHRVDVAHDGATALAMLDRSAYDLVLSDTKMPVLDGEGLYRAIDRRFPQLRDRLIFFTGDVLTREKREFLERIGAPVLAKPCDLTEVRRLVRRVLTAAGRRAS